MLLVMTGTDIGRRVRQKRGKMTQGQLAIRADVERAWISLLETGGIDDPGGVKLYRIARALGTTVEYLMTGREFGGRTMEVTQDEASLINTVRGFVRVPVRKVREVVSSLYHADDELFYDLAYEKDARRRVIEGTEDETPE